MAQSKPQPNCEDCTTITLGQPSMPPRRTMILPTRLALEHQHVRSRSRTNSRWRGTRRQPKIFFPQRSSAWEFDSALVWHSSRRIFPVVMSPRRAVAVRTCWTDMDPMSSAVHMAPASIVTTRSGMCG
eukprot:6457146-Amphidinium_carterae.1